MPKGHCLDYWRKWRKEYNFCGLRPQDARENDRYLDLVDKIAGSGAGLDGDFVLEHFTAGAARPLLRCKDDAAYEKALNYIVACLKRGETITGGDLAATINMFTGRSTQLRTEKPSFPLEKPTAPPSPETEVRKEEVREAARNQPAISDQLKKDLDEAAKEPSIPWTIDLCKTGKCPDDRRHLVHEPMRGNVCDAAGAPINQLTKCPVVERMKRAAAEGPGTGFVRASGAPDIDPHTGGKIIKPGGIRVVKTPLTPDELRACADDLIERSGFFTPKEVGLVDDLVRAGYEGIRSRADFVKKACNWFLTSAEGE